MAADLLHAQSADPSVRAGRDERRKAIIDVAREVFLHEGYAAASMSAIAARVGGSKATLYNYFPSKERLFAALIVAERESEFWADALPAVGAEGVASALGQIGRRFLAFALSDKALMIHRLVVAESGRFPELGRAFFENGPMRCIAILANWLEVQDVEGRLNVADPERAATQFLDLCKSGLHHRRLCHVDAGPRAREEAANVEAAVKMFLAAYGPKGAGPR